MIPLYCLASESLKSDLGYWKIFGMKNLFYNFRVVILYIQYVYDITMNEKQVYTVDTLKIYIDSKEKTQHDLYRMYA